MVTHPRRAATLPELLIVLAVSAPLAIGLQTFDVNHVSTQLPLLAAAAAVLLLVLAALSSPHLPRQLWRLLRQLTGL